MKSKDQTSLRSVTLKKTEEKKQDIINSSSQFSWTLIPATKLFKEISFSVFDTKNPMDVRRCIEDIEYNGELGQTPFRELWDKCVSINKEFFSKQQMEAEAKGGAVAPDRLASLKAFSNWSDLVIDEFKALIGGSKNQFLKADCQTTFSKTRGNVYDLVNILQKPEYMGMKFSTNKNDAFIDSQYSIYRQTIQAGAFKRLNDKSDVLMTANNDALKAIASGKRGIPKAPGPYDASVIPFKKIQTIIIDPNAKSMEKKLDNAVYALMVMGQVGKIDLYDSNYFKTLKAEMSATNKWYDDVLKKETIKLENQGCQAEFFKDGKKTNANLEITSGMENFKKLVTNPSVVDIWMQTNALLVLGDIVDTGSKNLAIKGKLDNSKLWIKRLKCGWNLFYKNLEKLNAAKIVPLDLRASNFSAFKVMVNDETEIITGPNSMDIDIKEEEKIYKKVRQMDKDHKWFKLEKINFGANDKLNWNTISYTPKLITVSFKSGFNMQFLDFNSAILACIKPTEAEYKTCAGAHASIVEYKDVMSYLEKVYLAMFKFKEDSVRAKTWRVMRTTISPFNSDIGDAQFYFQDFTVGKNKINLFKTMKEKAVEIFIASTINNAQVISMPYNNTYKYNDPKKCDDKATEIMGCWETKPGKFNELPNGSKMCDPKLDYDLPVRDLTNAAAVNTMLHIFIIGNSGQDLVPVKSGKLTGGILVWNRSMQQSDGKVYNNGFMRIIFSRLYVEVKFYEVRQNDQVMQIVGKFTISPSALPKEKETQDFLTGKCK